MDGANVEIAELVGDDNIFTFGEDSTDRYRAVMQEAIITHRSYYEKDSELKDVPSTSS